MARSEMRGSDAGDGQGAPVSPRVENETEQLVGGRARDEARPGRRFGASRVLTPADRDRILKEAREVEFPAALRGYDRAAVDRYVERMSRLITELEMSSSPEAAVRHALDEVSDETRDILQRAHETADEITARSRAKADDRLEAAEREGQELREKARRESDEMRDSARREAQDTIEAAEMRARELARSAEAVWRERRRLIEDMRSVGEQLVTIGEAEGKRFPRFGEEGSDAAELLRESSGSHEVAPGQTAAVPG
jgi:DivIVA domain-containing protein